MKTVTFLRNSTPEKPAIGYGDYVEVYDDKKYLFGSHASTCPNPYRAQDKERIKHWRELYALLAPCETTFECVDHPKFGKCLIVNNGERLKTLNANRNHMNEYYATEIFAHCGGLNSFNKNWRGSRGCFTIHMEYWCNFIDCFVVGEKGILILKDFCDNKKETV